MAVSAVFGKATGGGNGGGGKGNGKRSLASEGGSVGVRGVAAEF
jgi:hypothetical protein